MNEAETRAEHIDLALQAAGWGVIDGSRVLREHGITLGRLQGGGGSGGQSARAKADIADYVLVYRNAKLAAIEAKAWIKPLTEGVGQAKRYAAKLEVRHTYVTNGTRRRKAVATAEAEIQQRDCRCFAELGRPDQVRRLFVGFQKHLYAGLCK